MSKAIALAIVVGFIAGSVIFLCKRGSHLDERFAQAVAVLGDGKGDLDRVVKTQNELQKNPHYRQHARLLSGALLLRKQRFLRALEELSSVEPVGELREPVLEFTGECLYRMGHLAEAERVMRKLTSEYPENANAHRWLGAIYYDLGANDLAIVQLQLVTQLDPGDYRPHRLLGLMNLDFKQYGKAIEHYDKALALTPPATEREEIVRELAKALIAERNFKTALNVLKDSKDDAYTLALKGECYWNLGQKSKATSLLESASSKNPDDRTMLLLKARIFVTDGRYKEAVTLLKRVLARDPFDVECRYQLALAYRGLGSTKDYQQEFARWEHDRKLWELLAKLNVEAVQRPGDAAVRDQLAEICEKLNKPELAATWRRAAAACRKLKYDQS